MQIVTNHKPRPVIDGYELTATEREQFDYYDWQAIEDGTTSPQFFRYKGELYDLGEFFTTSEIHTVDLTAWHGYMSDSFFSGILVRYSDDFEEVTVGTYYN